MKKVSFEFIKVVYIRTQLIFDSTAQVRHPIGVKHELIDVVRIEGLECNLKVCHPD